MVLHVSQTIWKSAKQGLLQSPQEQAKQKFPDILIGKHKGQYLRWFGNEFFELDAPTRSGKGVGIVIPNCLHYRDSMVVYDPKYENFLITAGFRQAHGQEVYLFNPAGILPKAKTTRPQIKRNVASDVALLESLHLYSPRCTLYLQRFDEYGTNSVGFGA